MVLAENIEKIVDTLQRRTHMTVDQMSELYVQFRLAHRHVNTRQSGGHVQHPGRIEQLQSLIRNTRQVRGKRATSMSHGTHCLGRR